MNGYFCGLLLLLFCSGLSKAMNPFLFPTAAESSRQNALLHHQNWDEIERSVDEYMSQSRNAEHAANFYQVTPAWPLQFYPDFDHKKQRKNGEQSISRNDILNGIEVNDPQVHLNALSSREIEANFPYDLPIKVTVNHGSSEYSNEQDLNEQMVEFQLKWLKFQKEMIENMTSLITMEIVESGDDHYLISINRPNYVPEKQFVAIGRSRIGDQISYILPFDVFNDVIFIPNLFEATIKLKNSCLLKAKSFKQVCQCSMKSNGFTHDCEPFSNDKKSFKHDNSSFDQLHQVGGLDFDDQFVYLPSYKKPHVVFDFSCFSTVQNMRDLCQCQVLQNENEGPDCGLKTTTEDSIETTTVQEQTTTSKKPVKSTKATTTSSRKTTKGETTLETTIRPSTSKPTTALPMTSQMPSWENANMKHIKVYIKDDNLRIQLYSEYLASDPEAFESPQFEPLDALEDIHGKLIDEQEGWESDQGRKINFYIAKNKLKMKTTLPRFIILDKFYYKLPLNSDPYSKMELEIPMNEIKTLDIDPSTVTFGQYINDQFPAIETNVARVWKFYDKKHQVIDSNLFAEKCQMCKKCTKNCDTKCQHWVGQLTVCNKCKASDISITFIKRSDSDEKMACKPCDPWNQYCKLLWTNSVNKVENQMRGRVRAAFTDLVKDVVEVDTIKIDDEEEKEKTSKKVQTDEIATKATTIEVNEPKDEIEAKDKEAVKEGKKEARPRAKLQVHESKSTLKASETDTEIRKGIVEPTESETNDDDDDENYDEYYDELYGQDEDDHDDQDEAKDSETRTITEDKVGKIEEKELEDDDLIAETVIEEVDDEEANEDLDKEPEERLQDPDYIPSSLKDVDKASKDQHARLAHTSSFARPSSSKKSPMALRTMGRNRLPKPRPKPRPRPRPTLTKLTDF